MNESKLSFSVPDADLRDWFRLDGKSGAWVPGGSPGKSQPVGWVFDSCDCQSFPLWINSKEPDLLPQLAAFEIERMTGQVPGLDSHLMTIRKVARKDAHILVHVIVIGDLPQKFVKYNWQRFAVHPQFIKAEPGEIHLWQECGRWVAGFFLESILTHWHAFGVGDPGDEQVRELVGILSELRVRGICSQPAKLVIHSETGPTEIVSTAIESLLQIPIERREPESGGWIRMPEFDPGLQPEALVAYRSRKESARKRFLLGVFVCLLLFVGFAVAIFRLEKLKEEVRLTEIRVAQLAPKAESVRSAIERWETLQPAFDCEKYPVEIFHRVGSLLPPKGIRLTEFEIRKGRITIRGEASNVPTAIKFKADLERSSDLSNYQWQVPPPQITGDTAKFTAFGIPVGEANL
ncbi:MAG: hypothetical protein P1V20_21750 [Verrucomicrobiales bacterium]|nr:hypothetical protein [Verrucomicrobiales bacterium]